MIEVRPIEEGDTYQIVGLAKRMQEESPSYAPYEFSIKKLLNLVELCLRSPDWRCLIAKKDGRPVGFFAVGLVEMLFSTEKTVDDLALYVLPEERGCMAGPRMLKDMVEWAKSTGAKEIRCGITTEIDNSRVAALMERFGFRQTGLLMTMKF